MKTICIVGTGGFAREVLCIVDALGLYDQMEAFVEPDDIWEVQWKSKEIMGKPVIPLSTLNPERHKVSIGIASHVIRKRTVYQLCKDFEYINLIHPGAHVSRWVELGRGTIIAAGCILTCNISIGDFAQLNLQSTIGHDCLIGNYFTAAPAVNISGNCTIADNVYLGNGAATRQGISVCNDVTIGMGAMVLHDITEPGTYIGMPAKKLIK